MNRRRAEGGRCRARAGAAAALAAALLACAGPRGAAPAWTFPEAFDATQAVHVRGAGPLQDLVASLRRRGADYEVSLFDPVFGARLLSAAVRGGEITVEAAGPAASHEREARRLVAVLAEVYGHRYPAPAAGATAARSGPVDVHLSGIAPRDGCAFPADLRVSARGVDVDVRTLDVTCEAPSGAAR